VTQLVRQAARRYAGLEPRDPGTCRRAVDERRAYGSEFEKVVERVEAIDLDVNRWFSPERR
jgi:hypothetical protein